MSSFSALSEVNISLPQPNKPKHMLNLESSKTEKKIFFTCRSFLSFFAFQQQLE